MGTRALALLTAALVVLPAVSARVLENETLRCCTLQEPPFVFRDRTKPLGYDGIAIEYLQLIQERLGFKCVSFREYEDPSANDTLFTSFIYHLDRCARDGIVPDENPACQCDIGIGGWAVNEERLGRVVFLEPFAFDRYRALTHVENNSASGGDAFFLTTFSPGVWGSIAALVVIFTFLKLLDRRFAPGDQPFRPLSREYSRFERAKHYLLKYPILNRLRRATQSTMSKMIGQSTAEVRGDYGSTRQWVLNFVVVLCGLFLVLAYEATMTASLVQEDFNSAFRTINDIKNCRISPGDVCMPRGGAVEAYWKSAIAPKACHGEEGQERPKLVRSYREVVRMAALKKCKYVVALGGTLIYAAETRFCGTLTPTGSAFYGGSLSYVLPRGSGLVAAFNKATLVLRNEDVIPTVEEYLDRNGRCTAQKHALLTFKQLRLFFYFAFAGCGLIFIEMLVDPQQAERSKSRDKCDGKQGDEGADKQERTVSVSDETEDSEMELGKERS